MITAQGLGAGLTGLGIGDEHLAVALALVHSASAKAAASQPLEKELTPDGALAELLGDEQAEVLRNYLTRVDNPFAAHT